ncbi:MAG: head GIN domain-containing protein [Bacteroidia bacterium]|nr:DUF2807 domain-containing protein [Bacteroidia bacterium]MDW8159360.1 head GIN domain-containing protein [Bacteroidia bacterium]
MSFRKFRKVYLIGLLVTWIVFACSSEYDCVSGNRQVVRKELMVADFDAVILDINAEVYLRQDTTSMQNTVTIEAESNILPELKTSVKNRSLILKRDKCWATVKGIKCFISVRRLNSLTLNSAGKIYFPSFNSSSSFYCYSAGSGSIELNYNGPFLKVTINGSGDVTLSGKTLMEEIQISGSGDVNAFGLLAQESTVSISGSGDAQVRCEKTLNAYIDGSGNIIYQGNPTVNSRVVGLGRIIRF